MRGSAPQATEYKTDVLALPLIGSIRWLAFAYCGSTATTTLKASGCSARG